MLSMFNRIFDPNHFSGFAGQFLSAIGNFCHSFAGQTLVLMATNKKALPAFQNQVNANGNAGSKLLSCSLLSGLTATAIFTVSSAVSRLTRPIFRKLLAQQGNIPWYQYQIRMITDIVITQKLCHSLTECHQVDLVNIGNVLFTIGADLALYGLRDRPREMNDFYMIGLWSCSCCNPVCEL